MTLKNPLPPPSTSPRARISNKERARVALELRESGKEWIIVARESGYASAGAAYNAAMALFNDRVYEGVEDLRRLEAARLNALQDAIWDKAMRGDLWCIDRCLRIMERRARLYGLDNTRELVDITIQIRQAAEAEGVDPEMAIATALRIMQERQTVALLPERTNGKVV